MQLTDVGLISHLIAAIGFTALGIALLLRRQQTGAGLWLAAATILTAIWAGVFVLAARFGAPYIDWLSPSETLRSAAWIAFLVALLRDTWRLDQRLSSSFAIAGSIGFITALQLVLDLLDRMGNAALSLHETPMIALLFVVSRLAVAISGLVLLHNLYSNAAPSSRAGIRLLSIGLAGLFGYDLNLYTLQFLLGELSSDLFNIRGAVDVLIVPLLLLSTREAWVARVQVSRQVAFHTLSMSIIGGYLIVMALLAYGLRLVGGDWGRLLQISFLFATIILGAIVMVSPRFRAALRVQIAKNFFTYKYDYRQEWLRFISTVSRADADALSARVVEAVCAVLDSPGGALYTPGDDGAYDVAARWNYRDFAGGSIDPAGGVAIFLAQQQRIIELDEVRNGGSGYDGVTLPYWAASDRRAWLLVPLIHLDRLAGFIVVERTLAQRTLNWEDFDLLRTLGRQAASYIAEASTQEALDEAGKFDEFNRRFAFIMHDIKNLVSQLSLVARNAERHADNPAFRADMVATLQSSVGKMNDLLARLAQHNTGRSDAIEVVELSMLLGELVEAKRRQHQALTLDAGPGTFAVDGDPSRLEQLFIHLVQNAIDASAGGAPIVIELRREAGEAHVAIIDHGSGMSPGFVRAELFKPFHSTKVGGFGIGAYEAREIVRSCGGRLDVVSRESEGTVFTVRLPLATTMSVDAASERRRA